MAIPPGTAVKRVAKVDIESKFDEFWHDKLNAITPQGYYNNPAPFHLECPKGTRIIGSIFKDERGYDLANVYCLIEPNGAKVGDRSFYPTGLMVNHEWWYI